MTKRMIIGIILSIFIGIIFIASIIFAYRWSIRDFYTITNIPSRTPLSPPPIRKPVQNNITETTSTLPQPGAEPYDKELYEGEDVDIDSNYQITEDSLTNASQSKSITDTENNTSYTVYTFFNSSADNPHPTSTILKISRIHSDNSEEIAYFYLPITDLDMIGEMGFITNGIVINCDSPVNQRECVYNIRFYDWLPTNMVNINKISISKLTPSIIKTKYFSIVKNISQKLRDVGIENMYTEVTDYQDSGVRYKMTFNDNPVYQLFIMSPDFGVGLGEGGPTSFTPNTRDFTGTAEEITNQLVQPGRYQERNVQYTTKTVLNGLNTFWTFGDFGYASEEYAVQVLTEDKNETGYLIYISMPNAYKNNPQAGYESVKDSEFVRKILSVIE